MPAHPTKPSSLRGVFTLTKQISALPRSSWNCNCKSDLVLRWCGKNDIATLILANITIEKHGTEADMDISTCPLCSLVGLHLLSRDILSMTRGVSIKTRDTGEEYTASLDLPSKLPDQLEKLKETSPQVLTVICRLVARTVYLTNDFPLAIPDEDEKNFKEAPSFCMLVKGMDILDELSEVCEGKGEDAEELLEMPVPLELEYWNDWNQGHVMAALKLYRSLWSQIREPYLTPPKPVGVLHDPAVAGGMAKPMASSGLQQPKFVRGARARKAKKFTARDEDWNCGTVGCKSIDFERVGSVVGSVEPQWPWRSE